MNSHYLQSKCSIDIFLFETEDESLLLFMNWIIEKKDLQLWILFNYQYRVLKNCNNRVDYRHIYEKASVIYIRDFFIKSQIIKQIKKQKTQLKAVFLWSMEIYYSSKFQLVKGLPSLSSKEPQAIIIISMIVPIPKRPPVKSHNIPVPIFPT